MLLVALEFPDKFFEEHKWKLSSLVGVGRPDEEKMLSNEEKAKVEQLNATSAPAPASPAAPAVVAPKNEVQGSSSTSTIAVQALILPSARLCMIAQTKYSSFHIVMHGRLLAF